MRTRVSSADQGCMPRWRLLTWDGWVLAVMAAWLITSCVSIYAEDSKAGGHAKTPAVQQKVPTTKDGNTKIVNDADSAACKTKPDDPAIVTKTSEVASPSENDGPERMSRAGNQSSSGDSLTLHAPSKEEWTKDQIHLDAETTLKEESRSDKSENSRAGSDLKCTPHEAAPKTAVPN